jgi:hypothetical protein
MKVYLAQLKCPSNHCVLALAGEYESLEAAQALDAQVKQAYRELVACRAINDECGICHSSQLSVDLAVTRFATMAEAQPWLRAEEKAQTESAEFIKRSRN